MAFGDYGIAGDLFNMSGIWGLWHSRGPVQSGWHDCGLQNSREDLLKICGMIRSYGIAEDLLWHGRGSFQSESQCQSVLHPNDLKEKLKHI